jgi:hypothetical protein
VRQTLRWCRFVVLAACVSSSVGCRRDPSAERTPTLNTAVASTSERRDGASAVTAPSRQASSGAPTVSRWVLPQPHGNRLFSVWLAPWGDVIAVGNGGTVQHSVDYGEHWNVRQLGDMVLRGIWGPGDDRVYLVGDGGLYLSRDRAKSSLVVTAIRSFSQFTESRTGFSRTTDESNALMEKPNARASTSPSPRYCKCTNRYNVDGRKLSWSTSCKKCQGWPGHTSPGDHRS